jgi:Family of unknown function (DUF5761)
MIPQPPSMQEMFRMFERVPVKNDSTMYLSNSVTGGNPYVPETLVWTAFFSEENMKILQNGIRFGVYKKSKEQYIIGEQPQDVLMTIMRAQFVLLNNSSFSHLPPESQIAALNRAVLEYAVPQVYGEAQGQLGFLRDLDAPVIPISLPIQATRADKNMEFKNFGIPGFGPTITPF